MTQRFEKKLASGGGRGRIPEGLIAFGAFVEPDIKSFGVNSHHSGIAIGAKPYVTSLGYLEPHLEVTPQSVGCTNNYRRRNMKSHHSLLKLCGGWMGPVAAGLVRFIGGF